MAERPPTSVLLPTVRWTEACGEVADQLGPADELLVVCDHPTDPVARREDLPEGVRIVHAGEPEGCSGKANAIAAGMRAAGHDRVVWTDDDFHHPPDWLATLEAAYERHGPVTELPAFVGRDPLSVLLEPVYALTGTLGVYALEKVWAGAVCFELGDLDVEAFLADLERTVSDDGLLSEYLDVTPLRRVRRVEADGTVRASIERHVRFSRIVRMHSPVGSRIGALVWLAFVLGGLLNPIAGFVLSTLVTAGAYATFGIRRWTALLAFPALLAQAVLGFYVARRRTFEWAGRRYRWDGKFDVTVLGSP